MIVYNTTVKVETAMATSWLQWFTDVQAPEMLATGCFSKYHVLQVLETNDSEGPTYAVQFYANTVADYDMYLLNFEARFQQQTLKLWGSSLVSFSTVMWQVV